MTFFWKFLGSTHLIEFFLQIRSFNIHSVIGQQIKEKERLISPASVSATNHALHPSNPKIFRQTWRLHNNMNQKKMEALYFWTTLQDRHWFSTLLWRFAQIEAVPPASPIYSHIWKDWGKKTMKEVQMWIFLNKLHCECSTGLTNYQHFILVARKGSS